jgi:2'-5' RNA ligase
MLLSCAVECSGSPSVLLCEVPEAEPAVSRFRERLDDNASVGIPAHITVLYPFMAPRLIGPHELAKLAQLFAAVSRFRFELVRTDWFGDEVLWLAPGDAAPFRSMTDLVYEAFPSFPPFGGQYEEVVPHLTIGLGRSVDDLRAAEEALQAHLPIASTAIAITLLTEQSAGGQWARAATFPLA